MLDMLIPCILADIVNDAHDQSLLHTNVVSLCCFSFQTVQCEDVNEDVNDKSQPGTREIMCNTQTDTCQEGDARCSYQFQAAASSP